MRRRDYLKLYKVTEVTDENGKTKQTARYIGPVYRLDTVDVRRRMKRVWPCLAVTFAALAAGGLIATPLVSLFWGVIAYILCLVPLYGMIVAAGRMLRLRETITEPERLESIVQLHNSCLWLLVTAAIWFASELTALFTTHPPLRTEEVIYLLSAPLAMAGTWLLYRSVRDIRTDKCGS